LSRWAARGVGPASGREPATTECQRDAPPHCGHSCGQSEPESSGLARTHTESPRRLTGAFSLSDNRLRISADSGGNRATRLANRRLQPLGHHSCVQRNKLAPKQRRPQGHCGAVGPGRDVGSRPRIRETDVLCTAAKGAPRRQMRAQLATHSTFRARHPPQ